MRADCIYDAVPLTVCRNSITLYESASKMENELPRGWTVTLIKLFVHAQLISLQIEYSDVNVLIFLQLACVQFNIINFHISFNQVIFPPMKWGKMSSCYYDYEACGILIRLLRLNDYITNDSFRIKGDGKAIRAVKNGILITTGCSCHCSVIQIPVFRRNFSTF